VYPLNGGDSFRSLWLLPMIFGGMGTVFLTVGAGMILRSRPGEPNLRLPRLDASLRDSKPD
jgi:hypothetical protein